MQLQPQGTLLYFLIHLMTKYLFCPGYNMQFFLGATKQKRGEKYHRDKSIVMNTSKWSKKLLITLIIDNQLILITVLSQILRLHHNK